MIYHIHAIWVINIPKVSLKLAPGQMSYENDMFPMFMHYEIPVFSLPITHMTMAKDHSYHTNYYHADKYHWQGLYMWVSRVTYFMHAILRETPACRSTVNYWNTGGYIFFPDWKYDVSSELKWLFIFYK